MLHNDKKLQTEDQEKFEEVVLMDQNLIHHSQAYA